MLAVTVVFKLKKKSIEGFRKAILQHSKNSLKKERGCTRFDVCFDDDRPQMVFLFEAYKDVAAFERHRKTKHYEAFRKLAAPMLESSAVETWTLQSA
jgi:quinol monooxygenase YgiN